MSSLKRHSTPAPLAPPRSNESANPFNSGELVWALAQQRKRAIRSSTSLPSSASTTTTPMPYATPNVAPRRKLTAGAAVHTHGDWKGMPTASMLCPS